MEINFKANYIRTEPIKILDYDFNYLKKNASFVSLSSKSHNDMRLLKSINKTWDCGFLKSICNNIHRYNKNKKLYALTRQKTNFDDLNPSQILGIVFGEKDKKGEFYLDYLQTNPKYIKMNDSFPQYKHIGTAILNCIKNFSDIKSIKAESVPAAFDFYLKNDFKPTNNLFDDFEIVWINANSKLVK